MLTQTLNGSWQFRQRDFQDWMAAQVSGSVHLDLMSAGKVQDPFYGTNEEQAQWIAEKDWVYRRFFYVQPALAAAERIFLVCDGLDTLAEVRLNDRILGTPDNQFRTWRWEVKSLLKPGENRLEVVFRSPLAYIRSRERIKPMHQGNDGIRGGQHLRKSPSHFGWDWGPRLPIIGILKEIRLEGAFSGRLEDVRFSQEHRLDEDMVVLTTRVQTDLWQSPSGGAGGSSTPLTVQVRVTAPDGYVRRSKTAAQPNTTLTINLYKPQLWWPNGLSPAHLPAGLERPAPQPRYTVDVELIEGDPNAEQPRVVDSQAFSIGLRTLELRQSEDNFGKSFTFVVNGLPVFARGANWIPADSFPTRVSQEQLDRLIGSAVEANFNMLRVWGGGYYESDAFYDLCDQYGLLVWQDFQFACATYPLDDLAYIDNIRCEVIDNVRRLRHHACLALWCGNNEIETLGTPPKWHEKSPALAEGYRRFFYEQLPELLAAEDPDRPYWPASPSSGSPFNQPNGETTGDAHLWDVFHGFRPPVYYRRQSPRFVSEFGFQSLPALETIAAFAPQESWKLSSAEMRCHQRCVAGNDKLTWYLAQRFRLPRPGQPQAWEDLIYLSQVYQAEAMRVGVEHWRRHPERTSGALYWQLNDCWPVISWSSIDYHGRWKAAHHAARRFFAPLLLSIEDGADQKGSDRYKLSVWLTNELPVEWLGRLVWTLETLDGEVLEGGDQKVRAAPVSEWPNHVSRLVKLDFSRHQGKADFRRVVFVAELWMPVGSTPASVETTSGFTPTLAPQEKRVALQIATFLPEKDMRLSDPGLQAEIQAEGERAVIHISARRLARFVELSFHGAESGARFSDNYFDLPAGRTATIECDLPDGWTVEQARHNLRARALNQLGPCDSMVGSHWRGDMALLRTARTSLWEYIIKPALKQQR